MSVTITKRYNFRAYPAADQFIPIAKTFGCSRVSYNDTVTRMRKVWEEESRTPDINEMSRALTASKKTPEREWLSEVSSVPVQQAMRQAHQALWNHISSLTGKRKGPKVDAPRYKKKGHRETAEFTKSGFRNLQRLNKSWGSVYLAGIGMVRFRYSRDLPSSPTSVTLIGNPDGTFEVSFVVREEMPAVLPATGEVVGLDQGLTDLLTAVASDGRREKTGNPRWCRTAEQKLGRLQRELSRKEKGSKRWEQARLRLAKAHAKVARQRRDYYRGMALRLVEQFDVIAVEDFQRAGLMKTRMAKSIQDAGLGIFLRCLTEAAFEAGRKVVKIDRWAPTSQVCGVCGRKDGKKALSVREWECPECGALLDRDFNAAVNIVLAAGLVESLNARGGNLRTLLASAGQASEEPTEAGTSPNLFPLKSRGGILPPEGGGGSQVGA